MLPRIFHWVHYLEIEAKKWTLWQCVIQWWFGRQAKNTLHVCSIPRDVASPLQLSLLEEEVKERASRSVVSNSLRSQGLFSPWKSPGQNTGVGSRSLLQGVLPTQGSNPGLLHCRQILYPLSCLLERSAALVMETGERSTHSSPHPPTHPHNHSYHSSSKGSLNRQHYPCDNKLLTGVIGWKTYMKAGLPSSQFLFKSLVRA